MAILVPSATKMKSYEDRSKRARLARKTGKIVTASPCTIATRSLFSMTLGSTLSVDATLWSFPAPPVVGLMYTGPPQVSQLMWGAWIASWTW